MKILQNDYLNVEDYSISDSSEAKNLTSIAPLGVTQLSFTLPSSIIPVFSLYPLHYVYHFFVNTSVYSTNRKQKILRKNETRKRFIFVKSLSELRRRASIKNAKLIHPFYASSFDCEKRSHFVVFSPAENIMTEKPLTVQCKHLINHSRALINILLFQWRLFRHQIKRKDH